MNPTCLGSEGRPNTQVNPVQRCHSDMIPVVIISIFTSFISWKLACRCRILIFISKSTIEHLIYKNIVKISILQWLYYRRGILFDVPRIRETFWDAKKKSNSHESQTHSKGFIKKSTIIMRRKIDFGSESIKLNSWAFTKFIFQLEHITSRMT